MNRQEFNYLKKNIRSCLRDLDKGFEPDRVYDEDSEMFRTAQDLVVCASFLRDFLKN